jgi:hypothetical protein
MKKLFTLTLLLTSVILVKAQLSVASGTTLFVTNTNDLSAHDNIENNGTITNLTISGSNALNITGVGTINNLIVNKSLGTATCVSGMQTITGTYTPTAGVLAAGGYLKLKSDATGTARIDIGSTSGGYITGNVIVERYIPGGNRKFRFLGHPYTSMNVSELTDDIDITGTITGTNANVFTTTQTNNPSAFTFTEANGNGATFDAGWTPITSGSSATSLAQGQGVRLLIRGSKGQTGSLTGGVYTPNEVTIDMVGNLRQGDFAQTLDYSGSGTTKGWNLICNPYASNIDWDLLRTSNLTNVRDAVYSYRPSFSNGTYASYVNGSATNGGSDIIESGSAFFVQATAAGASINWQEVDKTSLTPTNTMFRNTQNITNRMMLQLKYDSTQYTDEVVLRFGDDKTATDNFDAKLDAENLAGNSHDLFVKGNNNDAYSIYHGSELATWQTENRTIQLGITTYTKGNYTLGATILNDFTNGNKAWLKDAFTNTLTEITTGMNYGFAVTNDAATQSSSRFSILFNPKEKVAPTIHSLTVKVSPNPAKGLLQLSYSQSDLLNTTITISNAEGKNVQSKNLGKVQYGIEKINISNLSAGIYFVQFSNGVEIKTEKIIIQ